MEAALPRGGMVFQLPAASYPEAGVVHQMPDYAHLTCHVYTRTLRWSYGTNRNRRWDAWHQFVAKLPATEMVRALCLADSRASTWTAGGTATAVSRLSRSCERRRAVRSFRTTPADN